MNKALLKISAIAFAGLFGVSTLSFAADAPAADTGAATTTTTTTTDQGMAPTKHHKTVKHHAKKHHAKKAPFDLSVRRVRNQGWHVGVDLYPK